MEEEEIQALNGLKKLLSELSEQNVNAAVVVALVDDENVVGGFVGPKNVLSRVISSAMMENPHLNDLLAMAVMDYLVKKKEL